MQTWRFFGSNHSILVHNYDPAPNFSGEEVINSCMPENCKKAVTLGVFWLLESLGHKFEPSLSTMAISYSPHFFPSHAMPHQKPKKRSPLRSRPKKGSIQQSARKVSCIKSICSEVDKLEQNNTIAIVSYCDPHTSEESWSHEKFHSNDVPFEFMAYNICFPINECICILYTHRPLPSIGLGGAAPGITGPDPHLRTRNFIHLRTLTHLRSFWT